MSEATLTDLAKRGEFSALENRWLAAIEKSAECRGEMLATISALVNDGRSERAVELCSTWWELEKEQSEPSALLTTGRELLMRCLDTPAMRRDVADLFEKVYADRPEIKKLIDMAGLRAGKTPRRALRTLDICLNLKVGDHLIHRSDEKAATVTEIDTESWDITIQTKRSTETLDADALALGYDAAGPNDFRILVQLGGERMQEVLDKDPVSLIISILRSHHNRLESDELEHLLCPDYIARDQWSSWWSKARTAMKKSPHLVLEGRNPIIITYHAKSISLEDEILPTWKAAHTPNQRLTVIDTYLRECKTRQSPIQQAMVDRFAKDLRKRIATTRTSAPSESLTEAIIMHRLACDANVPTGSEDAHQILRESKDIPALLNGIAEAGLYDRAIELIPEVYPEDWPKIYVELLPIAPTEACKTIAKAMEKKGYHDLLVDAAQKIPTDFLNHLGAVGWLWRGPEIEGLDIMPPREMLLKLLEHLGGLNRSDATSSHVLRDARTKIRAMFSASKYARFREVIANMDAGLASTIRRTIQRMDGLGQAVHADLLKIIRETHPELSVKPRIDPWFDEGIIFTSQAGFDKAEADVNFIKNVKMPENARAIGEAASHGDLSENSEYKFALEERDLLQARLMKLQNDLSLARVIGPGDVVTSEVSVGTRIILRGTANNEYRKVTILGPWDADIDRGLYNYKAPLCGKLKALVVGNNVILNFDDNEQEYRIEAIENALAQSHERQ